MSVTSNGNGCRIMGQVYEDEWFCVNPRSIYRSDFEMPKDDPWQEKTRQLILEAFEAMDKRSAQYKKPFYTMIPKRTWQNDMKGNELQQIAGYIGDRMANWIEQALEWAQRISNGFSWGHLCNVHDTASWNRVITWKEESQMAIVGGCAGGCFAPPACICPGGDLYKVRIMNAVPLVVYFGQEPPDAE